jgi:hypothetical protein
MSVPSLRLSAVGATSGPGSDEVELYHRTYATLLRSSGETFLRVLEPSHRAMNSSLHPYAASTEPDLGAFIYAMRRLPSTLHHASLVVMGQSTDEFARQGIGDLASWTPMEAPARRRRWFDSGDGTMAVLLASTSDLDDLVPTLVAYQIEWNKLHSALRGAPFEEEPAAEALAQAAGGTTEDWERVGQAFEADLGAFVSAVRERELGLRLRMLGGSHVGYARMTRRWWAPVGDAVEDAGFGERPLYFVSSNTHSLANLMTGTARRRQDEIAAWVRKHAPEDLRRELQRFEENRAEGSWDNFLYYCARLMFDARPELWIEREREEHAVGIRHFNSREALRISAQVMALAQLDPGQLDPRLGRVDAAKLAECPATIVNVEYPLGLAAYNILREICEDRETLRGVYVLGKAATLNADVGDVMLSSVVHDEHSRSTYWLDNAFTVADVAPYLVYGSGLDNQRAVTVRSTFLQNRQYLDFYYREAFTVVEMEAGPYCAAVYEVADVDRYPTGEAVNFAKLPIDFGIIHYASDTPYTQARTLGARGLSYYGMDSTYASTLAILRRILSLEGVLLED